MAMVPFPPDPLNPLCLGPGASPEEIKAALRKASLRWYPDVSARCCDVSQGQARVTQD